MGSSSAYASKDCEILVKLEFAPLTGERGGRTKGTIKSTRATTDPLYFDEMIIYTAAYYVEEAARTKRRMDLEIVMVLISDILVCIFVALQVFHVRKNSKVPSFISVFMLLILSVRHLVPLILNFEAVHLGRYPVSKVEGMSNGGRLEAYEIIVRLSSLVALLLQPCLLQLVLAAKQRDESRSSSWLVERKSGFVLLSLYGVGNLLATLLNCTRKAYVPQQYIARQNHNLWGTIRSYGGLIPDGFLLPQVLLNACRGSTEKALSNSFYRGISAVRVAPHAYNLYRSRNYAAFDFKKT